MKNSIASNASRKWKDLFSGFQTMLLQNGLFWMVKENQKVIILHFVRSAAYTRWKRGVLAHKMAVIGGRWEL